MENIVQNDKYMLHIRERRSWKAINNILLILLNLATQGEEELENFLEQHRRAMSASRERESQIR